MKLIIGKELQKTIDYCHNQVGAKEWSGLIFYTVEGTSLENMVLEADNMLLKDIGSALSTQFNFDEKVLAHYKKFPETQDMMIGLIHTHHTMDTFFSSTDEAELKNNSSNYPFYLSLIVNFKGNYNAKIGIDQPIVINTSDGKVDIPNFITKDVTIEYGKPEIKDCKFVDEKLIKELTPVVPTYDYGLYGRAVGYGYDNNYWSKGRKATINRAKTKSTVQELLGAKKKENVNLKNKVLRFINKVVIPNIIVTDFNDLFLDIYSSFIVIPTRKSVIDAIRNNNLTGLTFDDLLGKVLDIHEFYTHKMSTEMKVAMKELSNILMIEANGEFKK